MAVSVGVKKINRTTFYNRVRQPIFNGKLAQSHVDGFETMFNEWESRQMQDYRQLAYILATCYHESGHTMQPIAEYGKGAGRAYGKPDPETGKTYYGRGYCQITWRKNYQTFSNLLHVDLVHNPDLAMDPKIATDIIFEGMVKGLFTGKKLSDYFNAAKEDWVNARRIINGTDCAGLIANYAHTFYAGLI